MSSTIVLNIHICSNKLYSFNLIQFALVLLQLSLKSHFLLYTTYFILFFKMKIFWSSSGGNLNNKGFSFTRKWAEPARGRPANLQENHNSKIRECLLLFDLVESESW